MGIASLPDVQSFKRSLRNSWRKFNRVKSSNLPDPFVHAADVESMLSYFSGFPLGSSTQVPEDFQLEGECYICQQRVLFKIDQPADGKPVNWRETLVCPHCKMINRWRSCLHVFEAICEPTESDRVYLTESLSPVYQHLSERYPLLVSSEYFPDSGFGTMVDTPIMPVRNEDVTKLTFDESSLEIILCFDVLEHVPNYRAALAEFYRVLSKGGQLVLSVPFSHAQKTLVRATHDADGNIHHHVEPCYHGDPLSPQGVLSYYDFGMDLLDEMRQAGFQECFMACYYSEKWAYLNENVVFVARKL